MRTYIRHIRNIKKAIAVHIIYVVDLNMENEHFRAFRFYTRTFWAGCQLHCSDL